MSVREAGRLGGLSVLAKRGRGHFVQIGKAGQLAMRISHPDKAREWGRKGGRPKKPSMSKMGETTENLKGGLGPALGG